MSSFATYFSNLLMSKAVTKADVARKLKKSEGYIYALAKGLKPAPNLYTMVKLAAAIGCTNKEESQLLLYALERMLSKEFPKARKEKISAAAKRLRKSTTDIISLFDNAY